MTYDWKMTNKLIPYTQEWFNAIDLRFLDGAYLFTDPDHPFGEYIPFSQLKGKRVLEIGCGMGFHTELLCRAGAVMTSIDITSESINATRRRLEIKNLSAELIQADAESLDLESETFDFIWSWGVIHHSSSTTKIISNVFRMLKPGGKFSFMVYNLNSSMAYYALAKHYFVGFWFGNSLEHSLNLFTDGFTARYYTADQLVDLLLLFTPNISCLTLGQVSDIIPLPSFLRRPVSRLFARSWMKKQASKKGFFLFLETTKE